MILWLKFVCPILILIALWVWNRRRRYQRSVMEKKVVPHYEFGVLDEETRKRLSVLPGISTVLGKLGDTVKVYQVVEDGEVIAAILFSWPSSLWQFREERGETETLGSYSHIHWVEVKESERGKGHLHHLLDLVISDTHRISSGLTFDVEDPVLKEVFRKKFEFKKKNDHLILDYGNWS
jgi:hypothetical protein